MAEPEIFPLSGKPNAAPGSMETRNLSKPLGSSCCAKPAAEQQALQDNLYGAYYNVALLLKDLDKAKAQESIAKALLIKPTDASALSLQKLLNK